MHTQKYSRTVVFKCQFKLYMYPKSARMSYFFTLCIDGAASGRVCAQPMKQACISLCIVYLHCQTQYGGSILHCYCCRYMSYCVWCTDLHVTCLLSKSICWRRYQTTAYHIYSILWAVFSVFHSTLLFTGLKLFFLQSLHSYS